VGYPTSSRCSFVDTHFVPMFICGHNRGWDGTQMRIYLKDAILPSPLRSEVPIHPLANVVVLCFLFFLRRSDSRRSLPASCHNDNVPAGAVGFPTPCCTSLVSGPSRAPLGWPRTAVEVAPPMLARHRQGGHALWLAARRRGCRAPRLATLLRYASRAFFFLVCSGLGR
jgi:hypothetical protein